MSDLVTLDQFRNHDFEDSQSKGYLLAGKLLAMNAEGNLLHIESTFQKGM